MLGMEMDIEADLGIDSIKRVEILSAMEERMPHLPQVTPDMMGTLKTMGQICAFLSAGGQNTKPTASDQVKGNENPQTVQKELVSIVAELTGYPEEMLGMEMDIEADLGIDSIKRVEILSAMEERMPHLPQVTPDMVGTLKTMGQICAFLSHTDERSSNVSSNPQAAAREIEEKIFSEAVPRQIIDIVASPRQRGRSLHLAGERWIGVLCDEPSMAQAMIGQFEQRQFEARNLLHDPIARPSSFSKIAGLVVFGTIDPETAFVAAKNAAAELVEASKDGDAFFASVTSMDGAFCFSGEPFNNPEQGSLAGLIKTAALEWKSVFCRAIDLSPEFNDVEKAAQSVVDELLNINDHDPVEIGLLPDRRVVLQPIPAQTVKGPSCLNETDVVIITGGAHGVTSSCAMQIAQSTGATIALIGRSDPPYDIPGWLKDVETEGAMKKAIVENHFVNPPPTPKALEAEYRRQKTNIDVKQTIDRIRDLGVAVGYFSADVTDQNALEKAVRSVREQFGPVTALIHGAGILHDRLIVDKTVEQFRQVYNVKVQGLKNLLNATGKDFLRHIVLFSSVAARTGNTGQCDYAMANEVLNKMARLESERRHDCRVSAINWGPWDGGMVTPTLKKVFHDNQVSLIPIETGARMMLAEMENLDPSPVEVMIGSMLTTKSESRSTDSNMALLERRELDLHRYPVLASHIIGGKPVVPFALMTEWIGHGALKENPGLSLHGIDDFRLLSGIRIEQEKKLVRVLAGKPKKSGDTLQVDVELRNGVKNGQDVIHSRAKALLVHRFPDAPEFKANGKNGARAYGRNLDTVYNEILFHGDHLRAIESIESISDSGMKARLTNAPKPESWMQDPIQDKWMADPMVLDGAFQMAIVWCFEQSGSVCLPSYARAYRQYRSTFPTSGVTAVMEIIASTGKKITADFTFLDKNEKVVATLSGYEATVDKNLIHSFKKNKLDSIVKENRL
jgi:NAD(P)-dependent dehydrogenase (short-subunit alcohol dehydrogenase family)/acyl carrier protein